MQGKISFNSAGSIAGCGAGLFFWKVYLFICRERRMPLCSGVGEFMNQKDMNLIHIRC